MTAGEEEVIRNVIARLRCDPRSDGHQREFEEVRAALKSRVARIYLETWIIGALECLLPEQRNVKLGKHLSR